MKRNIIIAAVMTVLSFSAFAAGLEGHYAMEAEGQSDFRLEVTEINKKGLIKVQEILHSNVSGEFVAKCENKENLPVKCVQVEGKKKGLACNKMEITFHEGGDVSYHDHCMDYTIGFVAIDEASSNLIENENNQIEEINSAVQIEESQLTAFDEDLTTRAPSQETAESRELDRLEGEQDIKTSYTEIEVQFSYENIL